MAEASSESTATELQMESETDTDRLNFESNPNHEISSEEPGAKDTPQSSKPTCIVVLGMAGSGKTSFVQASTVNDCISRLPRFKI